MTNLGKGAWLHNNSEKGTIAAHVKLRIHLDTTYFAENWKLKTENIVAK